MLERISGLTSEQAKEYLLANLENKTISPFALRQSLNMLYTDLEEQGMVMTR